LPLGYPEPYKLFPKVACLRLSFLASRSLPSLLGTGGGGRGPAGGAGRIGKDVALKVAAFALDGPLLPLLSGAFTVVTLGTEFAVEVLGGRPGWAEAPDVRPRDIETFLVGDRPLSPYGGDARPERTSAPPMGMSPDVGVGKEYSAEFGAAVGESPERRSFSVEGES
jgi:hypothetical protein